MHRLFCLALLLAACKGNSEPTDSDLPLGCELSTNADTFDARAGAGRDITLDVIAEARCREVLTLSLSWRDPHTGAWTLDPALAAEPTVVLQPYEPQTIEVTFAPPEAGSFDDRLILQSDSAIVGGIILRFRGVGE